MRCRAAVACNGLNRDNRKTMVDHERDPRVILAAERTLLAWVRTGLAMMGFGFVVARFGLFLREMAAMQPAADTARGGGSLAAGVALVMVGVVTQIYAAVDYRRFRARFRRGEASAEGSSAGIVVAALLAIIGMAMAAYLLTHG